MNIFKDNNNLVKFYTGLTGYDTLKAFLFIYAVIVYNLPLPQID